MSNQRGLPQRTSMAFRAAQRWANASLAQPWPDLFRKSRAHLTASMLGYLHERPPAISEPSQPPPVAAEETKLPAIVATLSPGPLSYITSMYCVAIIFLSVCTHRIMHVVPPRRLFRLSPPLRLILRAPSAIMLTYALALVSAKLPTVAARLPDALESAAARDDADVLWTVFLALGLQSVTECFCKAINNDLNAQTSVNLLSYSYLLHFHSHPYSAPQMRPTPAVYLLVALTVSETLALQLMEAVGGNIRLLITFVFSAIGQAAMLGAVLSQDMTGAALLPSLQYFNRFPELLFFSLSIMTVGLHAISQLISEGRITRAIFGHPSNLPGRGDDFSIAVIRYGTACLETSALTGFGNEVGIVVAPPKPFVELGRGGAAAPALASFPAYVAGQGYTAPEVKDVRARAGVPKESDPLSRSPAIIKECWRFTKAAAKLALVITRGRVRRIAPYLRLEGRASRNTRLAACLRWIGVQSEADALAHRWAAARVQEEDDLLDEDFVPYEAPTSPASSDCSTSDEEIGGEEAVYSREGSVEPNALALVTDMEHDPAAGEDMQAVLLAHLTRGALSGPLTRRRYRAPRDADDAVQGLLADRRHGEPSPNAEVQSLCVVCRCEQRTVIFWPCRCLAVCEECKDHLGARNQNGAQHLCVCCRRAVDGWSRIYVP